MLHLFGIAHARLTFKHPGRRFRLTDVEGKVGKGNFEMIKKGFLKIYPVQGIVGEGFSWDIGELKRRENRIYRTRIKK